LATTLTATRRCVRPIHKGSLSGSAPRSRRTTRASSEGAAGEQETPLPPAPAALNDADSDSEEEEEKADAIEAAKEDPAAATATAANEPSGKAKRKLPSAALALLSSTKSSFLEADKGGAPELEFKELKEREPVRPPPAKKPTVSAPPQVRPAPWSRVTTLSTPRPRHSRPRAGSERRAPAGVQACRAPPCGCGCGGAGETRARGRWEARRQGQGAACPRQCGLRLACSYIVIL
jgi:hypothetical protein